MPMNSEAHQKVAAAHLSRMAYLYVRQSTLRQVFENTESTHRQYGLRDRAVALGWPLDRIVVIDCDLGQSGASAADREGFQRLVTEVSLGRVGIVLGLEVSRLARNNTDWHRLLELCALSDTLILDEDGLYDPANFNDRLLLGLKGAMSEAELHVLKARLRGGILNRARRGELKQMVPVGFVHDAHDRVILDPDAQVQAAVRMFFDTFNRTGSCLAVVKEFHERELPFPRRLRSGAHKGELVWSELLHCRARQIIHNPRYAGAFVFGRTKHRRLPNGKYASRQVPSEEWILLRDMHPGYISWEEHLSNRERVKSNALAWSSERRRGPAREGPALLQGLVICGACGERMSVRYHSHRNAEIPTYWCGRRPMHRGEIGLCQTIHGGALDAAIGDILVEAMTPLSIEVALGVQQELASRQEEADRLRRQHVERAKYEAELAQRRFLKVDPDNRLVADVLEADWNAKLRSVAGAQEAYEKAAAADVNVVDDARARGADGARQRLPPPLARSADTDEGQEAHAALADRGRDAHQGRYGAYRHPLRRRRDAVARSAAAEVVCRVAHDGRRRGAGDRSAGRHLHGQGDRRSPQRARGALGGDDPLDRGPHRAASPCLSACRPAYATAGAGPADP